MSQLNTLVIEASTTGLGRNLLAKEERIKKFRAEASKMASVANKRIQRLEKNGLENSPAYQGYLASGGGKFSIAGKNYQEVQAEMGRMKRLIDANTSTVRGYNKYMKEIAEATGIKYKNLTELRAKTEKFFELSNKVNQYLGMVEDMASSIGYQKIWESINTYVQDNRIDLAESEVSIDTMIAEISKAILEIETPEMVTANGFSSSDPEMSAWFMLPKE